MDETPAQGHAERRGRAARLKRRARGAGQTGMDRQREAALLRAWHERG